MGKQNEGSWHAFRTALRQAMIENRTFDDWFDSDIETLKANPVPIRYFGNETLNEIIEYDERDFCLKLLAEGQISKWGVSGSDKNAVWDSLFLYFTKALGTSRDDNEQPPNDTEIWAHLGKTLALRHVISVGTNYKNSLNKKPGPKSDKNKTADYRRYVVYILIKTRLWEMNEHTSEVLSPDKAFSYILDKDRNDKNVGVKIFDEKKAKTAHSREYVNRRNELRSWLSDYAKLEATNDVIRDSIRRVQSDLKGYLSNSFSLGNYSWEEMNADRLNMFGALRTFIKNQEQEEWRETLSKYESAGKLDPQKRENLKKEYESYWRGRNVRFTRHEEKKG